MFVTLSSFSVLTQARPLWARPSAPVEQINARAWESVRACDELRSAINGVDHAPTELVLTRQCADVSKLSMGSFVPPSATPCLATCRITDGGRPPQV